MGCCSTCVAPGNLRRFIFNFQSLLNREHDTADIYGNVSDGFSLKPDIIIQVLRWKYCHAVAGRQLHTGDWIGSYSLSSSGQISASASLLVVVLLFGSSLSSTIR